MTTSLTGLIGFPVSHSLSPRIHQHWLSQHGIDADYKLFTTAPARLRQTILHMRRKPLRGLNITVPHKQAVLEYLDEVDATALTIGAVNTIRIEGKKLIGTNTDAYGFITNLKEALGDLTPYLTHVVLLGAGGATRAAIVGLQQAGVKKITLVNRTSTTAQNLAAHYKVDYAAWENRTDILKDASLLVNTTSLGMKGSPPLEMDLKQLPATAAVHDIVYAPLETELLKAARVKGNQTVDGLGMLLYQAQEAFHLWHGILPAVTPELRALVLTEPQ